jgi:AcrR family transcriptional regulator
VAANAAPVTDGRSLRRSRNQDAVVEAILDLLTEGHAQPTAHQVSERSGVSMRSIFRLFDDMEALHRVAISCQVDRVTAMLRALPEDGPTADRVQALVQSRAEVFEAISPVRRLAVRLAPRSPSIRAELARAGGFFRDQVAAVFRPELRSARAQAGITRSSAGRTTVLDALDVATSWETWERLRTGQRLSPTKAAEVMAFTVSALLA